MLFSEKKSPINGLYEGNGRFIKKAANLFKEERKIKDVIGMQVVSAQTLDLNGITVC